MHRKRPEHDLQVLILNYLTFHGRRDLIWGAVANGELRHINVALRLKAEGVLPGVSDLFFLLDDGRTGWLELKATKGRLSDEQIGFGRKATLLGHYWACVKSLEEAIVVFKTWDVLRQRSEAA